MYRALAQNLQIRRNLSRSSKLDKVAPDYLSYIAYYLAYRFLFHTRWNDIRWKHQTTLSFHRQKKLQCSFRICQNFKRTHGSIKSSSIIKPFQAETFSFLKTWNPLHMYLYALTVFVIAYNLHIMDHMKLLNRLTKFHTINKKQKNSGFHWSYQNALWIILPNLITHLTAHSSNPNPRRLKLNTTLKRHLQEHLMIKLLPKSN